MTWTAFIDGGSRGNPGPAGAGVQLRDSRDKVVFAGGFFLGRRTNNQAEYAGLVAALDLLEQAGAESIRIFSDSELLVRQTTGEYKVKSAALKPLVANVRQRKPIRRSTRQPYDGRPGRCRADRYAGTQRYPDHR